MGELDPTQLLADSAWPLAIGIGFLEGLRTILERYGYDQDHFFSHPKELAFFIENTITLEDWAYIGRQTMPLSTDHPQDYLKLVIKIMAAIQKEPH